VGAAEPVKKLEADGDADEIVAGLEVVPAVSDAPTVASGDVRFVDVTP